MLNKTTMWTVLRSVVAWLLLKYLWHFSHDVTSHQVISKINQSTAKKDVAEEALAREAALKEAASKEEAQKSAAGEALAKGKKAAKETAANEVAVKKSSSWSSHTQTNCKTRRSIPFKCKFGPLHTTVYEQKEKRTGNDRR